MKASVIRKEIEKVSKELSALKTELPNFERLYSDNQTAEAEVKESHRNAQATLEALSAARGRVVEARELLEQHQSDIKALELKVSNLEAQYDKQHAGERLAAAKEHHETLMEEYRSAVQDALTASQERLRAVATTQAAIENRRAEIESLGLGLGIYTRNEFRGTVKGTNFTRLGLLAPGLFDDMFPELKSDQGVLFLLTQITEQDEVVRTGEIRQVLAHRETKRRADLRERTARSQAETSGQ